MKRIKTVNGYVIYQAMTQRDADKYGCEVGNYNLYQSCEIRDYGLAYSYAEFDNVDSLAVAIELASGSNFAVANALADELSDSTVQDMDLALEIERRLDAGQTVEYITEVYDTDEQCFTDVVGEKEKPEEENEETEEVGLKQHGLIRLSTKTGKVDTAMTALGSALLKLWGLQNTTKGKQTWVFELDSGQMVAKYIGTGTGFPQVEKAIGERVPEIVRRQLADEPEAHRRA